MNQIVEENKAVQYVGREGENHHTKYNHVEPIAFDKIPEEEKEQALMEFAEGSLGLELCLRAMWMNQIKTLACCSGDNRPYDDAYIAAEANYDFFGFLSKELLEDDRISIKINERKEQIIRIHADPKNRETLMIRIANDILSGRKDNKQDIEKCLKKPTNLEWLLKVTEYSMRKANCSEEMIAESLRKKELYWLMNYGTSEQKKQAEKEIDEWAMETIRKYTERIQK